MARTRCSRARPHAAEGARAVIRGDNLEAPGSSRTCRAPSITCHPRSGLYPAAPVSRSYPNQFSTSGDLARLILSSVM
jgi:hypothetical protein